MPSNVSYNFLVIGPISSMPAGTLIVPSGVSIWPTGEITAAVPQRPISTKSFNSSL